MRPINLDSFPHLTYCLLDELRCWISTRLTAMMAFYWQVSLGRRCRFYGSPVFRRLPGSQIVVGARCEFRSAVWSNFAGINHPCILATLKDGATIRIGNDCGFSGVAIGAAQSVIIGDRVMVGANSSISDTDWHPVDPKRRAAGEAGASLPVRIEDDVWLGANVVVLKGVTIGAGSTIAANSVVTKSIPPGVIAGGIPARPLKRISEVDAMRQSFADKTDQ
jgi:acetyltransferase-like isoleucine patch superfamily enzyme